MENTILEPREALNQARYVASLVKMGVNTYDEAKRICQPLLDIVNNSGKEIAKKYNKKYSPITFTGLAR